MSEIPQVQNSDVSDHAVILDVREKDEWDAGHAPGAVHIPLAELPSRLHELPDTDDGTLAVTCRGGGRSSRAVAIRVRSASPSAASTGRRGASGSDTRGPLPAVCAAAGGASSSDRSRSLLNHAMTVSVVMRPTIGRLR